LLPIPEILLKKQVLKNGMEVKLQRNALTVLEAPTGFEDDDEIDGNNSFCGSFDMGEKDMNYCKTMSWFAIQPTALDCHIASPTKHFSSVP
jgi:hypothetical protein